MKLILSRGTVFLSLILEKDNQLEVKLVLNFQCGCAAIDAPGGFLFEWWSVFWDIFIARTNEKHSEPAAAYIEVFSLLEEFFFFFCSPFFLYLFVYLFILRYFC